MVNLLSIIALGFFLGMRHATDPDHVIAVTAIVSRERQISKSAWIGAFWGIGHTLTIFVAGAAIILFDLVIPPRIGLSMELAVGLMLVLLGVMNVRSFLRGLPVSDSEGTRVPARAGVLHAHPHRHGDYVHSHPHSHEPEGHPHTENDTPLAKLDRALSKFHAYRPVRPLMIGVVHGLAGSAAVALLVLTTIRDPRWAVAYLLVFGIGTIAGMMLITMSVASSFHLARGGPQFSRRLALASGILSLAFGLVVAYQICVVNGLFTAHPHWSPR
ncbi:MAG TPA: high-affinity nickel-transport family protein [Terriglobales bacterium]|nr:high-affinity nickel-transport family protein [Terriglobales bacterium]